jgi:hypothetical protein
MLQTSLQSESTCLVQALIHGSSLHLGRKKCRDNLHATSEHLEVEYFKFEKVPESWDPQESDTSFQFSTSKCSELGCKVTHSVLSRHSHKDPHSLQLENVKTLCMPLQIYNIHFLVFKTRWLHLFHLDINTQILTAHGRKMSRYFACWFGALRSGILQIWKKFRNPEVIRNLAIFSDFQYSTSKYSKLACNVNQLVSSRHSQTDPHCAWPNKSLPPPPLHCLSMAHKWPRLGGGGG